MEPVRKFIDHNRYLAASILSVIVIAFSINGCAPTTVSPFTGDQVTYHELEQQRIKYGRELQVELDEATTPEQIDSIVHRVDAYNADLQRAYDDLERKHTATVGILEMIGVAGSAAAGPWAPLIPIGIAAIATGLGLDNRRKDGVIKLQKKELEAGNGK